MAHFAKLGSNGKVIQVLTLNNNDMLNADGVEDETVGQQYLELNNNWPAQMWIQTSYNTSQVESHKNGGTLHLEETMQVLVILGMKIIKSFGLKNHMLHG
jgi:hypothetical protein